MNFQQDKEQLQEQTADDSSVAEDSDLLSEHSKSMLQACEYCLSHLLQNPLLLDCQEKLVNIISIDWDEVDLSQKRQHSWNQFWNSSPSPQITSIHFPNDLLISPFDFRRQFHSCNLPCLVSVAADLNGSSSNNNNNNNNNDININDNENKKDNQLLAGCFQRVNQEWRIQPFDASSLGGINRQWFLQTLGAETMVPLRLESPSKMSLSCMDVTSVLDEDGRATECETKLVPLKEWIDMLKKIKSEPPFNNENYQSSMDNSHCCYLKDWHLQSILEDLQFPPCYECPVIFEMDLLNSFLRRFTKGDYRFCYWGPKDSFTSRHSDVLHSFSWSYNVVGRKRWNFYNNNNNTNYCDNHTQLEQSPQMVTVIQEAGQAMFVPSQWQHDVVNLQETISINHNWITTANLDLCWECLTTEIQSIDKELAGWGIDSMEAHESMLRGCVGLDVSAFFLMILVRITDVMANANETSISKLDAESCIDLCRMVTMVRVVLEDQSIQLKERLLAVLQSIQMATDLIEVATRIVGRIPTRDHCT